jgi:ribokinase
LIDESDLQKARISLSNLSNIGPIAVMPDFFIDRFIKVESFQDLWKSIARKGRGGGGGSIRGIIQDEVKGGNAVNVAYSLAKFGAKVKLLAISNSLPKLILTSIFSAFPNVELEILPGNSGYTVALEGIEKGRHVNIMLSDTGAVSDFDGTEIPKKYWRAMKECRAVSVLNWGANKRGTELCKRVFSFAKKELRGKALTFFDPSDPSESLELLPSLKKQVFDTGLVDVMSLNENEARILGKAFVGFRLWYDYTTTDLFRLGLKLSECCGTRVDIHTRKISLSCMGMDYVVERCARVKQRIVTGAGDVWDAADLIGYLAGISPTLRLAFANAAAGLYVSSTSAEPPELESVLEVLAMRKSH